MDIVCFKDNTDDKGIKAGSEIKNNKGASWLYAELFVNDETLKNVNDEEWNLTICHVTLSLSRSEGLILSSLSDLSRNRETSPKKKKTFKEHSCRSALLKMGYLMLSDLQMDYDSWRKAVVIHWYFHSPHKIEMALDGVKIKIVQP